MIISFMAAMLATRQLGESTEQGICIPSLGSMVLVAHQRGICTLLDPCPAASYDGPATGLLLLLLIQLLVLLLLVLLEPLRGLLLLHAAAAADAAFTLQLIARILNFDG